MRNAWVLCAVLMLMCSAACAAQPEKVVFSWTPGDATAKTQAGDVAFKLAPGAKLVDCPAGKGVAPNEAGRIGHCEVKLGTLPETGTISFWAKFSRELRLARTGKPGEVKLFNSKDVTLSLSEGKGGAGLRIMAGHLIRNKKWRGKFGCSFTHLRPNQWYHFAITLNAPVKNAWRGMLNGVTQPEPWWEWPFRFANTTTRIDLAGLLKREGADPATVTLGPIKWIAGQKTNQEVLAELKGVKGWAIPENRGEGLQAYAEPFDAEKLGGEVIYENKFDRPLKKDEWVAEGPMKMAVENEKLVVRNSDHVTFWLKKKLPRDFVAAWDFQPSQLEGLAIVFVSANGLNGKDLFDPTLKKRSGSFNQYVRGDIRSYHFSYYAGTRGSANGRKNPGLVMVAICKDLVSADIKAGKKGPWRVAVVRRGNRIDLTVNNQRFLTFVDNPAIWGPAHGGGYLGLRQMKRSQMISYDNLVVRKLRAAPAK
jgi:uncharacterized protein DUF1961